MMSCYRFTGMYSKPGIRTGSTRNMSDFDRNLLQVLIQSPVRGYKIGSTLKIDILTHREVMNKSSWVTAKLIPKLKITRKNDHLYSPPSLLMSIFQKKRNLDDLDNLMMNILNLMSSNDPGG